jgi:hypothetical protein
VAALLKILRRINQLLKSNPLSLKKRERGCGVRVSYYLAFSV